MAPEQMFLPVTSLDASAPQRAPVNYDRSFSFMPTPGYEAVTQLAENSVNIPKHFSPNASYERYLKMHKVLVGQRGAEELEEIHDNLRQEQMPKYLSAAGWAAVEAALVKTDEAQEKRQRLLSSGVRCWRRAIQTQRAFNEVGPECLRDYAYPYRMALEVAVSPLLKDVIAGDLRPHTFDTVLRDCLNVAQANAVRIHMMKQEGNIHGLGEHVGLGYECNALLLFNRQRSPTRFIIPSMMRADTGYHHRQQTHDLLAVHQKWGEITGVTPIEIKSTAGVRERERYKALLVRGKMHLSQNGRYKPEQMLDAITACEEDTATSQQKFVVNKVSERFNAMAGDYYLGKRLGKTVISRSTVNFFDNSIVKAQHPGLQAA